MTELEKAKTCRKVVLTGWGEVNQYDWSPDFAQKHLKEAPDVFLERNPEYEIDITKFTESDLYELGFGKWEEGSNLMLMPIWMKPFCKNVEVTSIFGEKKMLDEADNDHRFGCLAYGVKI